MLDVVDAILDAVYASRWENALEPLHLHRVGIFEARLLLDNRKLLDLGLTREPKSFETEKPIIFYVRQQLATS